MAETCAIESMDSAGVYRLTKPLHYHCANPAIDGFPREGAVPGQREKRSKRGQRRFTVSQKVAQFTPRLFALKIGPRTSARRNEGLATTKDEFGMDDAPHIKILPHLNSPRGQDLKQRFWEKIAKRGDDECWHWTGHCKDGYGRMKIAAYTSVYASRVALAIATGVEPEGMHALHSCDNPPCCNPRHLRWGTQEDNMRDKVLRGRGRTGNQAGENNGAAKISTRELAKVIDGFRRGLNNKQIARELPIGHAMVSKIRRGHMWREQARSLGWTGAPDSRFPTRLSEGSLS